MLPRMSGLEALQTSQDRFRRPRHIPIIMLTAKAEEVDRIVGLEFGADDYVTKPFSPREMILRIKAILRRGQSNDGAAEASMTRGSITIDPARHRVLVGGQAGRPDRGRIQIAQHADETTGPGAGARSSAQRSVGLRKRDRHAHGRYPRAPIARETGQSRQRRSRRCAASATVCANKREKPWAGSLLRSRSPSWPTAGGGSGTAGFNRVVNWSRWSTR